MHTYTSYAMNLYKIMAFSLASIGMAYSATVFSSDTNPTNETARKVGVCTGTVGEVQACLAYWQDKLGMRMQSIESSEGGGEQIYLIYEDITI